MKKTLKALAAVICGVLMLSLTACQKDSELILGTWIENEATYTSIQNGETFSFSMLEPGETMEMTFNADGTYTTFYHSNEGDSEENGSWSIKDDILTINAVLDDIAELDAMDYHIDQLDKKTCNLTYNESGEDEDGPYTVTIVIKMTKK